jgi:hypothetical protein
MSHQTVHHSVHVALWHHTPKSSHLDKQIKAGVLYYQLLWAGYNQTNNWQPLENLECPLLVAEYEGKHVLKQTKPLQAESAKILHFCKSESTLVVFW